MGCAGQVPHADLTPHQAVCLSVSNSSPNNMTAAVICSQMRQTSTAACRPAAAMKWWIQDASQSVEGLTNEDYAASNTASNGTNGGALAGGGWWGCCHPRDVSRWHCHSRQTRNFYHHTHGLQVCTHTWYTPQHLLTLETPPELLPTSAAAAALLCNLLISSLSKVLMLLYEAV